MEVSKIAFVNLRLLVMTCFFFFLGVYPENLRIYTR